MYNSDCYVNALHVGLPLVFLSWLGHIAIYIIYKSFKRYLQNDKSTTFVNAKKSESSESSESSEEEPLTSQVSLKESANDKAETIQQQLASRELQRSSIQDNLLSLAPLVKEQLENLNISDTQKGLIFSIMNKISDKDIPNSQDFQSIFNNMEQIIKRQTTGSNNLLDD